MPHHIFCGSLLVLALCGSACRQTRPASAGAGMDPQSSPATHQPGLPAIECPLRKAGVDPAQLRPFAEVEKYIAFLDRPERAAWQKPDRVIQALGLRGDETVLDLGAGSGYFTFPLARALPQGKVIAADTEPEMVRHIHHRAIAESMRNVETVLIPRDDPRIPKHADLVFICDVLHHVPDRTNWLGKVVSEMKPRARLVLVEFKEGPLPEGPPESVKIPQARILGLAQQAGLSLVANQPDLLPYQSFLVFRKTP